VVQIIVYTGAILMLFLFVLMLSASTPPTRWSRRSGDSDHRDPGRADPG
jgi:NADH:ubiquinone oxidoreductase subunit 6 (subunit J)